MVDGASRFFMCDDAELSVGAAMGEGILVRASR